MNRRGFLTGLGALLATTALVKPAPAPIWTIPPGVPPLPNGDYYVSICHPWQKAFLQELMDYPLENIDDLILPGRLGEYLGITFIEDWPHTDAPFFDTRRFWR